MSTPHPDSALGRLVDADRRAVEPFASADSIMVRTDGTVVVDKRVLDGPWLADLVAEREPSAADLRVEREPALRDLRAERYRRGSSW